MVCQICGAKSGYFPLCKKHNAMRESGKVRKCDSCGKWIETGKPLCLDCWREEQDLRKQKKTEKIKKRKPFVKRTPEKATKREIVKVVSNRDLQRIIEDSIAEAEKSVYILSPYIEQFGHLFDDLESLIERKGMVKVVYNEAKTFKNEQAIQSLLDMEANLKEDKNLHAKLVIVDEKIAIVSSANLLSRSFLNNNELGIYLTTTEHIKETVSYFNRVYEKASSIDSENQ